MQTTLRLLRDEVTDVKIWYLALACTLGSAIALGVDPRQRDWPSLYQSFLLFCCGAPHALCTWLGT